MRIVYRAFNGEVFRDINDYASRLETPSGKFSLQDEYLVKRESLWPSFEGWERVAYVDNVKYPTGHIRLALTEYLILNAKWSKFKWMMFTGVEIGVVIGTPLAIVAGYFHLV